MHALEIIIALNERADREAEQKKVLRLVEAYRRNNPGATAEEISAWLDLAGLGHDMGAVEKELRS